MRSLSSSSLVASKLLANRFSNRIECGMPTGLRFFIGADHLAVAEHLVALDLDVADLDLRALVHLERDLRAKTAESGGSPARPSRTAGRARPETPSGRSRRAGPCSGRTATSTERPTLRSLKRSRISDTVTDFAPSYLIERTTRRSVRTKRTIQPVLPGSRSPAGCRRNGRCSTAP